MTLSNGDSEQPLVFRGPGEIRLDEEGLLEFVLYDPDHEGSLLDRIYSEPLGTWAPDSEIYDLTAIDLLGASWRAENLRPGTRSVFGKAGAVVRGRAFQLVRSSRPGRSTTDSVWLYFAHRIDTPANVSTVTTVQEGDGPSRKGAEHNVWKVSCGDLDITLRRGDAGFEVNVLSSEPLSPQIDTRIEEALWFVLGQPLVADIVRKRLGDSDTVIVRSRRPHERVGNPVTPYLISSPKAPSVLATVFCKYLTFVLGEMEARFHPVSVLIKRALRAADGTMEDMALGLCVAVEGVVRIGFMDRGRPSDEILAETSRLEEHLGDAFNEGAIAQRIKGFLNHSLRAPSARTALKTLRDTGVIDKSEFEAWEKLRPVPTHGREFERPPREVYELTLRVRVLLSKLVLHIIGYDGVYTDFSEIGWPEKSLGSKQEAS